MLNVMASTAKSKNPGLVSSTRNDDEDNVARQLRVAEMRREVSVESAPSDASKATDQRPTYIILFGAATGQHFDSD
jgi:hypothetical protein